MTPSQSRSFVVSHRSGAPGYAFGSWSSQSHALPAGAQPHFTKPSPSSSGQAAPPSQPGPVLALADVVVKGHALVVAATTTTAKAATERR